VEAWKEDGCEIRAEIWEDLVLPLHVVRQPMPPSPTMQDKLLHFLMDSPPRVGKPVDRGGGGGRDVIQQAHQGEVAVFAIEAVPGHEDAVTLVERNVPGPVLAGDGNFSP